MTRKNVRFGGWLLGGMIGAAAATLFAIAYALPLVSMVLVIGLGILVGSNIGKNFADFIYKSIFSRYDYVIFQKKDQATKSILPAGDWLYAKLYYKGSVKASRSSPDQSTLHVPGAIMTPVPSPDVAKLMQSGALPPANSFEDVDLKSGTVPTINITHS